MDEFVDVIWFIIYRSCSKAALISCDQCNIFFHLDCLDPPLTAPPTGYWLCPIHPQHFVVKYFHYLNKLTTFWNLFFSLAKWFVLQFLMQKVKGLIFVELTVPKTEFLYKKFGKVNHRGIIYAQNLRQNIMNINELSDSNCWLNLFKKICFK